MFRGKLSKYSTAQRWNIAVALIIFILVTAFYLFRSAEPMKLGFEEDHMTITGPSGAPFVVTVDYQDILSVSEADTLDPGVRLEGLDTERCRFGSWQNDAYGNYTLCVSPAFPNHIVLETVNGIVAFNYESADSTQHLYSALVEMLRERGWEV